MTAPARAVTHAATLPAGREARRARPAVWIVTALAGLLGTGVARTVVAQDRIEGNHYANPRYGIQVDKPAGWYFITASTVVDLARKTAGLGAPPAGEDPVRAAGFAVIVSQVPNLGRDVAPQVVLMVHDLPQAPTDVVATCERLRSGLSDPEAVTPTRATTVDGRPAARLDFRGFVDGNLVRATALCTFRDRRVFVVAAQALAAEFEGAAGSFETILRSFRLK